MGWPSSASSAACVWRSPWAWTRFSIPARRASRGMSARTYALASGLTVQRADERSPPADPPLRARVEPPLDNCERARVEPDGPPLAALADQDRHRPGRAVQI